MKLFFNTLKNNIEKMPYENNLGKGFYDFLRAYTDITLTSLGYCYPNREYKSYWGIIFCFTFLGNYTPQKQQWDRFYTYFLNISRNLNEYYALTEEEYKAYKSRANPKDDEFMGYYKRNGKYYPYLTRLIFVKDEFERYVFCE